MTPLAKIIAARIRATGPMPLSEYMDICLLHPAHGYYATRDPFGKAGDFITAPEIHQMFGEICGLALAQAWLDQGAPAPFVLAEPGPGRGTLMADMLRAIRVVPGMVAAAEVTLIEASPHLRQVQGDRIGVARHLDSISDLPQKPLFLIANEFFDALPIRQMVRVEGGWAERMVGVQGDRLVPGLAPPVDLPMRGPVGQVREFCPAAPAVIEVIAARIAAHGGAALIFDYGGWNGAGDTFQALAGHAPADPFAAPGQADLTAHVNFAALAAAAIRGGAVASHLRAQGDWLLAMGAATRAKRLAAAGDTGALAALNRLTDAGEMGQLFKVLAIWPKGAPPVPGFEALDADADHA